MKARTIRALTIGHAISLLAALVCGEGGAQAQPPQEERANPLSEMTIEELLQVQVTTIASATPKPVGEAPSIVTVITFREIEAMGATSVEEALESVPGLHVSRSSFTYAPKYLFRGVSSSYNPQVLVMQNGVPITNPLRGDRGLLSLLPVEMISRIEVIRGPGSAVWGADALSGVINVVTKSAEDLDGWIAGARGGSFATGSGWVLHGERDGDLKAFLGAQGSSTAGQRRIIGEDMLHGAPSSLAPGPVALSRNAANLLLDLERGPWRLRGSYQKEWNVGTGQGIANALDPVGKIALSRTLVDLTYDDRKLSKDWELPVRASYYQFAQEIDEALVLFPPGTDLGAGTFPQGVIGKPEEWERRLQGDVSAVYKGWRGHRLRLGIGYAFSQIYKVRNSKNSTPAFAPLPGPGLTDVSDTPASYMPNTRRHNFSGLLQEEWSFARDWELTVGARYDYYSDFKGSFSPRVALLWKIANPLTARLFYGHAFRAPSEGELYYRNNVAVIGNPALKPERIDVFEATLDLRPRSNLGIAVIAFHQRLADLISYVPNQGAPGATAQNTTRQTGTGFAIEGRYRPVSALDLRGSYSFQKTTDGESGADAGGAPHHKLYLRAEWRFLPDWLFTPQLVWIGPRARQANDPRPALGGYASLDVVLRRSGLFGFDLAAYVKNVLDEDIREPGPTPAAGSSRPPIPGDLPQAGRSFFVEASYRFR